MRKSLLGVLLACATMFTAAGCGSMGVATMLNTTQVTNMENGYVQNRMVQVPAKDFKAVKIVFAEATVNTDEDFKPDVEDSRVMVHNKNLTGSKVIYRKLLAEADKLGAHGIVDVRIEAERVCTDTATRSLYATIVDASTRAYAAYEATENENKVGFFAALFGKSEPAEVTTAVANPTARPVTDITPNYILRDARIPVRKGDNKIYQCDTVYYGTALAIQYTNAIIPAIVASTSSVSTEAATIAP